MVLEVLECEAVPSEGVKDCGVCACEVKFPVVVLVVGAGG